MTWAPDYATLANLKRYLDIEDTNDDVFLTTWITAVSRNIDEHTGRQFGQVDTIEPRRYRATWDRHLGVYSYEIDDLFDIDDLVVVDANAVAVTDYDLWPDNAPLKGKPYTQLHTAAGGGRLTATGLWGWSSVPAGVATGLYLQAARLAARRNSPFGISGSPQEQGEIRLLAQLDPDFRVALKPYVRKWWAA